MLHTHKVTKKRVIHTFHILNSMYRLYVCIQVGPTLLALPKVWSTLGGTDTSFND